MKRFRLLVLLLILTNVVISQTTYTNLSKETTITEQLPIRAVRKSAIWFNMGWNGFVGIGPAISSYATPKIAIDAGLGLSSTGFKLSGRGRYLFSVKNFTPFVGAGFQYGLGSRTDFELKDGFNNNEPFRVKIFPSPFLQLAGGFEYMAKKGFFVLFNVGYAILLKDENYTITKGSPSPDELKALDISYRSGIVFEGGIGYAF